MAYHVAMLTNMEQIKIRHDLLASVLDEKQYRLYLAAEAQAIGRGGMSQVAKATGASRNTISSGLSNLLKPSPPKPVEATKEEKKTRRRTRGQRFPVAEERRQRQVGGGRKRTTDIDPTLKPDLDALIEAFAAGDPRSPLRSTCKRISNLN